MSLGVEEMPGEEKKKSKVQNERKDLRNLKKKVPNMQTSEPDKASSSCSLSGRQWCT